VSIDFRGSSIALSEPRDFRHVDDFSVWFNSNRWSGCRASARNHRLAFL